jgi:uncharacterized membrane protein YraQ (UPF0718 family)
MEKQNKSKITFSLAMRKTGKTLANMFIYIVGTIFLIALINTLVPKWFYVSIFTRNNFIDPWIGALLGSISAGSPAVSYIISGELLNQGIGLATVTAFLVAWVTVGIVQLPFEINILGKKFAFWRNVLSFVFAVGIAIVISYILR